MFIIKAIYENGKHSEMLNLWICSDANMIAEKNKAQQFATEIEAQNFIEKNKHFFSSYWNFKVVPLD
jgi:hypothetical protein